MSFTDVPFGCLGEVYFADAESDGDVPGWKGERWGSGQKSLRYAQIMRKKIEMTNK
ncbi:hypothetical protein [Roseovarius sp. THAF9]|uniref:hypothetical protein n=1 Tax=Roseovarius sp. THAF9 TaxID=2587847 RepID=UPI001C129BE1|nr:hypothetical protein [Roseovarius sp. THAF9]